MSLHKVIGDIRFMQAASLVAVGMQESKQAQAYMRELGRLDKLLAQELLK